MWGVWILAIVVCGGAFIWTVCWIWQLKREIDLYKQEIDYLVAANKALRAGQDHWGDKIA